MSRAAACLSGAASLLAVTGTTASAAPHTPRTERVGTAADGTQADGPSSGAALSADGRHVAFTSTAPSLGCAHFTPCTPCYSGRMVGYVAESDGGPQVHIRNRTVGRLTGIGHYQGVRFTWMGQPAVDPTCSWITYAATLPATDADRHRWGGRNDLPAGHPSVNADGTVVAFASASPDLVEGDTNGVSDIFLRTVK
ncbi:hypothetical protein ACIBU0_27605 [Streptomyces sp. NPDC049627]|uniref:hypothetical protein n=1 Tax=Streptomyces sp. NPDC049627 TaxID=3365595 RepID=UPI0037B7D0E0